MNVSEIIQEQHSILSQITTAEENLRNKKHNAQQTFNAAFNSARSPLDNVLASVTSNANFNAAPTQQMKEAARQHYEQNAANHNAEYELSRQNNDRVLQSLRNLPGAQAELVGKWQAIEPGRVGVIAGSIVAASRPKSLTACATLIEENISILIKLGDPSSYKNIGRSAAGGLAEGILGGIGAVGGILVAIIAGGLPVIGAVAVIAFIASVLLKMDFGSLLAIIGIIIAVIGVLAGLSGIFESDEDKQKRLANRKTLADGCTAYLLVKLGAGEAQMLHSQALKELDNQKERNLQANEQKYNERLNLIAQFDADHAQATQTMQDVVLDAERVHRNEIDKLTANAARLSHKIQSLGIMAADWSDTLWQHYSPEPQAAIQNCPEASTGVRIGRLYYPVISAQEQPVLVQKGHLFILSDAKTEQVALQLLRSIVSKLVFTSPVLSAKFIFIDPKASGNFLFGDLPPVIGNYTYSDYQEIQDRTRDLENHMKQVQNKIGDKLLEDFNRTAPVPEMYHFVCIAGFPNSRFSNESIQHLENILNYGARAGVFLIMQVSTNEENYQTVSKVFNRDNLKERGNVIEAGNEWQVLTNRSKSVFRPDSAPNHELFSSLISRIRTVCEEHSFRAISYLSIRPTPEEWWSYKSRPTISVPFGLKGNGDRLRLNLGDKGRDIFVHALVAGRTGSGKSTLFHTLINNLALMYSPEEVELYLLDFKQGVEFRPYADFRLPHARVIAIESEPEFGLSVLNRLWREHLQRAELLKAAGVSRFEDYVTDQTHRLPRVVVIFDEYQMLFGDSSSIADKARTVLNVLARQGRSSGIHLILGSQSKVDGIETTTYEQFSTRILLQASENLAAQILGQDNTDIARQLNRAGEVVYNEKAGSKIDNVTGQIAMISREEIVNNLTQVKRFSEQKAYKPATPPVIFRGDQPSNFGGNEFARNLYALNIWPSSAQIKQFFGLKDWVPSEYPALAWLGEAIEIRPPTAVTFRRRSRSNLLIVGNQEEIVFGMLSTTLFSLPLFHAPGRAQFYLADLSLKDEEWADVCEQFQASYTLYQIVVQERDAAKLIEQVHDIVMERKRAYSENGASNWPTVYLIVAGMNRLSQLRPVITTYGTDPSPLAFKLNEILEHGPELGVHTLLWVDSSRNFDKVLGRAALNHINQRIALRMSENESQYLLDDPTASTLKDNRAILFVEDAEQPLEKFKPYVMPSTKIDRAKMIDLLGQRLRSRVH